MNVDLDKFRNKKGNIKMTCIVGYIDDDKNIYMGSDSASVVAYSFDMSIRKDEKIFIKNDIIFGFSGSFRLGQLLRYSLMIPEKYKNQEDLDYVHDNLINSIRYTFKENGFTRISSNIEEIDGTFIFGYNGNLYTVYSDLQICRVFDNFASTGCGAGYALGNLYALKESNLTPEQKIKKSLKCSYHFSAGVRPPFNILKLSNKEN